MGIICLYYEKCIANSICNCIQFRLLLDQSVNLFIYSLKLRWEVFKDRQKFMMKQSRSCHTFFLAISSHWKCSRNETRNTEVFTLNGLIRDSSRKPFQMQSPPRCYQLHKTSVLSFKSRPGKLECNHHTWRIQIWPIRNKLANVFPKTPQTMDADLMEMCGIEQLILSFRFRKCIEV